MTHKLDIETSLERSLRNQVTAPRLDSRFDASVWARIEAEAKRGMAPVAQTSAAGASSSARWMFITNVLGISVAALLVIFFGLKAFSGVAVNVPVPQIAPTTMAEIAAVAVQTVTIAAVIFGLMFTPIGRRLRAELT